MNGHGPIGYGDVGHVQNGVFRHIDLGVVAVLHGKRARARCTRCYCGVLPGRTWLPRGEAALSSQRRDFAWRRRRCGPRSRKAVVRPRFSSVGRWTASIVRGAGKTSPSQGSPRLSWRGGQELDTLDTCSPAVLVRLPRLAVAADRPCPAGTVDRDEVLTTHASPRHIPS